MVSIIRAQLCALRTGCMHVEALPYHSKAASSNLRTLGVAQCAPIEQTNLPICKACHITTMCPCRPRTRSPFANHRSKLMMALTQTACKMALRQMVKQPFLTHAHWGVLIFRDPKGKGSVPYLPSPNWSFKKFGSRLYVITHSTKHSPTFSPFHLYLKYHRIRF